MRVKKNFVLRQVAETWVVLPLGSATASFNGMISLNETGALLWKALEQGSDREALIKLLTDEYYVHSSQAQVDVDEFLQKLINVGCVEL